MVTEDIKVEHIGSLLVDLHPLAMLDTDSAGPVPSTHDQDTQSDLVNSCLIPSVDMHSQVLQDIDTGLGQQGDSYLVKVEVLEHSGDLPKTLVPGEELQREHDLDHSLFVPLTRVSVGLEGDRMSPLAPPHDAVGSAVRNDVAAEPSVTRPASVAGAKRANDTTQPANKKPRVTSTVDAYDDRVEASVSKLAVDQPCFKAAEKHIRVICDKILHKIEALDKIGFTDKEITTIYGKLRNVRNVRQVYPGATVVGFLGDTAAGKSSLINCLVNQQNVVRQSDDGDSGTSVPQELAIAEVGQPEAVEAVVYYLGKDGIKTQTESHIEAIDEYIHTDTKELDPDDRNRLNNDYHTAISFFVTLLCNQVPFRSTGATAAFFEHVYSSGDMGALERVKCDVQEYISKTGRQQGATTISGKTVEAVNREIKGLLHPVITRDGETPMPSPWPLVRKVTTHLDARILSEGVALVDLPGTSDTNRRRVQTARGHLKQCDIVVIVHPISRIQSSDSVSANIDECTRADKQGKIIIVATATDRFEHGKERDTVSLQDQAMLNALKARIDKLSEEINGLEGQQNEIDEETTDPVEIAEEARLSREVRTKASEKADIEAKWKEEGILTRSRYNIVAIKKRHRDMTDSKEDVPVFCVSNTAYQMHMQGYSRRERPQLSLEATDIVRLRQHLFAIPARRKHAKLQQLCKMGLSRMLTAAELLCSKSKLERKQDVLVFVMQPLENLKAVTTQLGEDLKSAIERVVRDLCDERGNQWVSQTEKLHETWARYGRPRYGAFVRRDGVWKDANKIQVDWNRRIADIMQKDILDAFSRFKSATLVSREAFRMAVGDSLTTLCTDLVERPGSMGMDSGALRSFIEQTRGTINDTVTRHFKELGRHIGDIQYDATSVESADSYLVKEMKPAYEDARARKKLGKAGVFADMQKIMTDKLYGRDNIFGMVVGAASARLEDFVDQWLARLSQQTESKLHEIVHGFHARYYDEEPENVTRRALRKELLTTVEAAKELYDTELAEELKKCKEFL
ncbi:hypothetical protein LTR53_001051 [Teratosphaeriaceae sp. CCFEE 6253]|nr:hypothetical protein LTR53_001051 [Teratosphaeriaceae sp. CCFEE 6253]